MRARHRLSKLLLRHGLVYDATAWTRRPRRAGCAGSGSQCGPLAIVFDECYGRMLRRKTRRDALDQAIAELAAEPPYVDVVERLVCLRGVSTLTAFALDGRARRLDAVPAASRSARSSASTPSEDSSGERRRQGAITKTGNTHARRLLVEAAWHQRRPLRPSVDARAPTPRASRSPCEPTPTRAPAGSTNAGTRSRAAASGARSSWSPSRASSPDTAGRSRRWSSRHPQRLGEESAPAQRREERPARTAVSSPNQATLDARERHRSSSRTPGHAAPTRAYESRHRRRRQPVRSPRRNKKARKRGPPTRAHLTNLTPYQPPALAAAQAARGAVASVPMEDWSSSFTARLGAARIGSTYNQYAGSELRRDRLRAYLDARAQRLRSSSSAKPRATAARASAGSRSRPSASSPDRARPRRARPSSTACSRELGLEDDVLLWNVVPTHPGTATSNRPPTRSEIEAARPFLAELVRGRRVVAVGRVAAAALDAPYVRHPSHGGAAAFADGLRRILGA